MNLARWVFLKHHTRASGGVVYRSFTDQRQGKFGWGRSKFFLSMSALVEVGMAEKRPFGWVLATTRRVRGLHKGRDVRHKCTLQLTRGCSEEFVKDMLPLKLAEMGWRQKDLHILTPEQRFNAGRITAKTFCKQERQRLLSNKPAKNLNMGPLGSSKEELLNFAQNGWMPMNTESLMRLTGKGRTSLFAWKKRVKGRGWMSQQNRSFDIPPDLLPGLPVMYEHWQKTCQGKVSWGPVPRFHQAALYKMEIDY